MHCTAYCYRCSVVCVSVCLLDITMSCAETDEPIDMPFVSWIWMGLKNHQLLSGARIPQARDSFACVRRRFIPYDAFRIGV